MGDKRVADIRNGSLSSLDSGKVRDDFADVLIALTTAQARIAELQALVETLSGYEWQTAKKLVDAVMSTTPPESKP